MGSQVISLISSFILILIIPRLFSVTEYGYWQLYWFYTSYIVFLHFGIIDGVYLRYGGQYYENLNKNLFRSTFRFIIMIAIIISLTLSIITLVLSKSSQHTYIFLALSASVLIVIPSTFFLNLVQATNRIKEFVSMTIAQNLSLIILVMGALLFGFRAFKILIVADLTSKLITLIVGGYFCRDLVFGKLTKFSILLDEIKTNIACGIKLLISNVSSYLFLGVFRIGIERNWDVVMFGKVSLAMNISNIFLILIGGLSTVVFPVLRRKNSEFLSDIYLNLKTVIVISLTGVLLMYQPIRFIFDLWLPQYSESFIYTTILFPICLYESKMQLLIKVYFNTLRKETWMLKINIISVCFSVLLCSISVFLINNIIVVIICMLLSVMFRCIVGEIVLSRLMGINYIKDIAIEFAMVLLFVVSNYYMGTLNALMIYLVGFVAFIFYKKQDIQSMTMKLRKTEIV